MVRKIYEVRVWVMGKSRAIVLDNSHNIFTNICMYCHFFPQFFLTSVFDNVLMIVSFFSAHFRFHSRFSHLKTRLTWNNLNFFPIHFNLDTFFYDEKKNYRSFCVETSNICTRLRLGLCRKTIVSRYVGVGEVALIRYFYIVSS